MQDHNRIGAWLAILENKIERYGNRLLRETDITVMQLRVMKYLQKHPEESQIADLSEFFDVSHTSMVHVVNSLETKGYVTREPIRRSRGKKILLTEEGRKLAEDNENRIDLVEKTIVRGFTEEEEQSILKMLQRMNANLDDKLKQQEEKL